MQNPEQIDAIRRLNDAARAIPGVTSVTNVTMGFQALCDADRSAALVLIARFSKFDDNNAPYGEHDFGAVFRLASGDWTQDRPDDDKVIAVTVFWKIDYYEPNLAFGSEAPWDEDRTKRVLTIMLSNEY
ncbi:DUF3768 domain-containing protein [Sphingobium sp. Ant17]|jgi:hypothetical protein|uniref:DUF3768 domain-containing protein n=1 Tax=Sphingobium sp. Ant17 TaxID=1461752 RepID=UPI00044C8AAF|nr:DUF3768 domain-containing protein [Sphingobium sp. Ant17]EXS70597.1 hypothetical protein BF95_05620 [Sphingobium sp. Ant17]|tara:strand:+ start:7485 stop:7871 length:387 start_codon:yes stop_codon:yes gene_type:complete